MQTQLVNSLVLSTGENPHVLEGQNIQKLNFDGNAAIGEEVHEYTTPEVGAVIRHDVPLKPNGAGVRVPHDTVTLPGNKSCGSTTQVEFNPLNREVTAARD